MTKVFELLFVYSCFRSFCQPDALWFRGRSTTDNVKMLTGAHPGFGRGPELHGREGPPQPQKSRGGSGLISGSTCD